MIKRKKDIYYYFIVKVILFLVSGFGESFVWLSCLDIC